MVYSSLNKAHISDDYLSDADWDYLQEIATALEPFEEVTIQTEGRVTVTTPGLLQRLLQDQSKRTRWPERRGHGGRR